MGDGRCLSALGCLCLRGRAGLLELELDLAEWREAAVPVCLQREQSTEAGKSMNVNSMCKWLSIWSVQREFSNCVATTIVSHMAAELSLGYDRCCAARARLVTIDKEGEATLSRTLTNYSSA